MSGLLIAGVLIAVPGVHVVSPHETPWSQLSPGDYRQRRGRPHQVMLHTTKGDWPQEIRPGSGPAGRAQRTAQMWIADPTYSSAPIVVGSDGESACLADLVLTEAYHATVSNPYSIGIETYQELKGVIYQAAIDSTVAICGVIADACAIPRQFPGRVYNGHPMRRMLDGGRDCFGFFGHRDNTERRGRGDPGDAIFVALERAGWEPLDFEAGQDLEVWRARQRLLNAMGETLVVDGLPGPGTMDALHRRGFVSGRQLLPA